MARVRPWALRHAQDSRGSRCAVSVGMEAVVSALGSSSAKSLLGIEGIGGKAMKVPVQWIVLVLAIALTGCGSPFAGTYEADARLLEGKTESTEPGYSLVEFRATLSRENRSLTFSNDGRFVWNTGDVINEGTWRTEGDTLFLREDINDGRPIGAALQRDREWRLGRKGEIIRTGAYNRHNLEVVYLRQ